ncbi:GntR family transcriptional regulator [Sinomonas cellulolyticus]|uniref:PLP-dependent aminotransferase family protein n=1 Tax=Sinomonas cellulolyticus TaxID=2801916 RepID=A0ABS1K6I8_9MICC|nr:MULTISPECIES: PLP-dependent aminotransferase family protein [Sinomonas]MBL0707299.1 PLP-dependent aminotransferase family protein [Sinomonas cellulolyticus]GHG50519.1 GntR family transcriptional regulator [Sinomonas sp. KCTC 49339]
MTSQDIELQRDELTAETQTALERAEASHRHEALFSERAHNIKQSAVRDVFDISVRPGLVSLAGGSPSLAKLPLGLVAETASRVITEHGMEALHYGTGKGTPELRALICEIMAEEGILGASPEDVVVTTGSQSAQDIAAKVFCNPGDVVLVEDPTYVGALNTFEAYQVRVEPVRMDEDGLVPDELEARIEALEAEGKSIKLLYTIPSFNNPSGITMAAGRRQRIVDICREHNILVLEDNPYGMLRFDGHPLTPLRADNPDDVIYCGSFSKIFSPGVRLGWALVPKHLYRRFYLAAEAVVLCPSTLNQLIVTEFFRAFDWRGYLAESRAVYAERCKAMLAALGEAFPREAFPAEEGKGIEWTTPEGGFFVWVTLPAGIDTYPLLHEAIDAGVVFIPGAAFTPSDTANSHLRLAFSGVEPERIREGVRRLAPVIRAAVEAHAG